MRSRLVHVLLLLAAVVAAGGAGYWVMVVRPLQVEIARPEQNVRAAVFGLGTIEARVQSKVGFEVAGILVELNADHGDFVRAGAVLARLQRFKQEARVGKARAGMLNAGAALSRAEAAVSKATTQLAQRKQQNQRRQTLVARNVVSEEVAEQTQMDTDVAAADLRVATADVEIARAAVEDAKSQHAYEQTLLDDHVLRAPYDAVVVSRLKELGSALGSSEPLFTLIDPKTVWVLAYVDESRAGPVRTGQSAVVRLRSLPGQSFAGEVVRVGFESDRVTEERRVYVACTDCPEDFHLGEQAEVEINVATLATALLVPEAAITGFNGASGTVWTVEDGRLQRRVVSFGHRTLDARVAVVGGLAADAAIVIEPKSGLTEGRAARIAQRAGR